MKAASKAVMVALTVAIASIAHADNIKIDVASTNPAVPPVIRASTNTVINYPGGTPPANVLGSLDAGDSTFNRPVSCAGLSGVGTAVSYDTITLTNSGASTATVNMNMGDQGDPSSCTDPLDTFLVEYNGSFNPASPLTNCLQVNDDSGGGFCSAFSGITIPSGATRVYVLTSFDNAAAFSYEVTFAGTTPVTLQSFEVE